MVNAGCEKWPDLAIFCFNKVIKGPGTSLWSRTLIQKHF